MQRTRLQRMLSLKGLCDIMVIQKHFELDNTEMWLNLVEYIDENIDYVEQITDKSMRFHEYNRTKYFEMIMYWTVYHFEEKIKDIAEMQRYINHWLTSYLFPGEIEFLIREYLNDQSSI